MAPTVFLIGFGQPQSLDDIPDFLQRVTGRIPSDEAVKAARARYERIGGQSPLFEITARQAEKLEISLEQSGATAHVYIGMRHSEPTIRDALDEASRGDLRMAHKGSNKAVAITLAPQFSEMSAGVYLKLFDDANGALDKPFEAKKVRSYGTHPLFIEAVAAKLKTAIEKSPALNPETTPVLFSAHSLPAKILESGDTYVDELKEGMKAVAEKLRLKKTLLAFQSKGGGPVEWLGPSIEDVMAELANSGEKQVVVSPLGFVSDHVETLYDLDIQAASRAKELGLEFRRAESLNDSPEFIKFLAELVIANL